MTNVPDPENAIAEKLEGRTIYIFPFLYKHVHAPPLLAASSRVYETRLSSRQSWATNGTRGTCYVDYVEIFLEHRQSSLIKRRIIVSLPPAITFPSDFRIIRKTYVQSFKKNRLSRFGKESNKCDSIEFSPENVSRFTGEGRGSSRGKRSDYSRVIRVTGFIERAMCTKGVSTLRHSCFPPLRHPRSR